MIKKFGLVILGLALGLSAVVFAKSKPTPLVEPPANVIQLQESFAQVVEAVKPAVVNISAVQITRVQEQDPYEFFYGNPDDLFRQFFGGGSQRQKQQPQEYRREGTGSGVIINADGFVLTNNHVVQGADELTVTLWNDKKYKAKVVGTDPRTDLAVVRIKGDAAFSYVPLGDSSKTRVGDWVLAIGSPFGLQQTVTSGIISAIRQSLKIEGRAFRNLLQTDAAINRGNSGGALVNLKGELIGINTAIYAPTGVFSGIGFAIPVNDAKVVLNDLIEKGYVERSWIGVEVADLDDVIAGQFGLASTEGALLNAVFPDSPAAKAGLLRGDVVTEFDGTKIKDIQSLQDKVAGTPPGRSVSVRFVRGGKSQSLTLKTEKMPKAQETDGGEETGEAPVPSSGTAEWLGATFATLDDRLKDHYEISIDGDKAGSEKLVGVVAVEVPAKSDAAEAGIQEGDLIQAVNRAPIKTAADLKKLSKVDLKNGVVFDTVREGRSLYLSYKSLR